MRINNVRQVAAALLIGPKSTQAIVNMTGLSYSTVSRALTELGAEQVGKSWPIEWRIPEQQSGAIVTRLQPKKSIAPKGVDNQVSVELAEAPDWIPRWNKAREQFGGELAGLEITPTTDPKALKESLTKAARNLASIAYAVQEVQGKPDWFTLLGGELEPKRRRK